MKVTESFFFLRAKNLFSYFNIKVSIFFWNFHNDTVYLNHTFLTIWFIRGQKITELIYSLDFEKKTTNFSRVFVTPIMWLSREYYVSENGRQHQEMTVQKRFIVTFNVKTAITLSHMPGSYGTAVLNDFNSVQDLSTWFQSIIYDL